MAPTLTIMFILRIGQILSIGFEKVILLSGPYYYELITGSFHPESMRFAVILLAIIPIIAVYPYLQKYFAKGVNVGGVKE